MSICTVSCSTGNGNQTQLIPCSNINWPARQAAVYVQPPVASTTTYVAPSIYSTVPQAYAVSRLTFSTRAARTSLAMVSVAD